MSTFTIDAENNITALAGLPAGADQSQSFSNAKELAKLTAEWPASRLVDTWNSFAGVAPFDDLKPVKKFTSRKAAVARIWEAVRVCPPTLRHRRPVAPAKGKAKQSPAKATRRARAQKGATEARNNKKAEADAPAAEPVSRDSATDTRATPFRSKRSSSSHRSLTLRVSRSSFATMTAFTLPHPPTPTTSSCRATTLGRFSAFDYDLAQLRALYERHGPDFLGLRLERDPALGLFVCRNTNVANGLHAVGMLRLGSGHQRESLKLWRAGTKIKALAVRRSGCADPISVTGVSQERPLLALVRRLATPRAFSE